MQYVKHDFHSNFLKATKSGDKKMVSDILAYELVELTTSSPFLVIAALQKNGIKIDNKANAKEIISKATNNIGNKEFVKDLVVLISQRVKYSNETGGAGALSDAPEKIAVGAMSGGLVGAIAGAVDSIARIFGGGVRIAKTGAASQKEHDQAVLQQQALALLAAKKAKKGMSGTTIAIIVISSVAIIGLVTFLIVRQK